MRRLSALYTVLLVTLVVSAYGIGCSSPVSSPTPTPTPSIIRIPASPIPQDEFYANVSAGMKFIRNTAFPAGYQNPLAHVAIPQNQFMAPNGKSNMHCDPYMTDTYNVSGPVGRNTSVISTYRGVAECATITFDSKGRIITTCTNLSGPVLLLLDPLTLDELASYTLPQRSQDWDKDPIAPTEDTSGGAYFYIDNQDRAVIGTNNQSIQIIQFNESICAFQLVREYDLRDYVVVKQLPARDKVGTILPDWNGLLWYVTRYGMVGTVNAESGEVHTIELKGEEIENSFAVAEDGVYIVSDYALYRFHAGADGTPVVDWRTTYDRGTQRKPGQINQGSGTTPNVFGAMVAIGDNAEPRMNMLYLNRSSGKLVCKVPVFGKGASCTENAPIGFAREGAKGLEYPLIVENNYGYQSFFSTYNGESTVGGVTRVDAVPDGKGGYTGKVIWTSSEVSPTTVPKLSLASGLIYLYTKDARSDGIDAWYFTALDFETGKTVFKILTGTGMGYNNNYAPITIGPEGGTACVGCRNGLICIRDGAQ